VQNILLPQIPLQEVFYYRQRLINEFCNRDIKKNKAYFYSYREGEALRGPNEVCTFLLDFNGEYVPSTIITELFLVSDVCPRQNKKCTTACDLLTLASIGQFQNTVQYFPSRGHSLNVCDRDFATVKRKISRLDRIHSHEVQSAVIKDSSKTGKFTVNRIDSKNSIRLKKWWHKHYKNPVLPTSYYGKMFTKHQNCTFQTSTTLSSDVTLRTVVT